MGIKNFGAIIKRATSGVTTATYGDFRGQTWAIDASIFCYRFAHNAQTKRPNSHIDGFYQLFLRLLKAGIRPVLVFDGKSPQEKQHTVDLRAKHKQKNMDKVECIRQDLIQLIGQDVGESPTSQQLESILVKFKGTSTESGIKTKMDELIKANKNVIHFQPGIYDDIRSLCTLMNVPFIRANGEADVLCAKLYLSGQVHAIMSEDSDILLYGGGRLIRKFSWTNEIEVLDLNQILKSLGITYNQFIDLAILSGTDYTPTTIGGLGPINALDYIVKGMTIEQIIKQLYQSGDTHYHIPTEDNFPYQDARTLIKNACQYELPVVIEPFNLQNMVLDQLINVMTDKCHYRPITIQKHFDQLREIYQPPRPKIKISLKKK